MFIGQLLALHFWGQTLALASAHPFGTDADFAWTRAQEAPDAAPSSPCPSAEVHPQPTKAWKIHFPSELLGHPAWSSWQNAQHCWWRKENNNGPWYHLATSFFSTWGKGKLWFLKMLLSFSILKHQYKKNAYMHLFELRLFLLINFHHSVLLLPSKCTLSI